MAYRGWAIMFLMFLVFVMGLAVLNTVRIAYTTSGSVVAFEAPTPLPTVNLPDMAAPVVAMIEDRQFGRGTMVGDLFIQCAKLTGPDQWISNYSPGVVYAGQVGYGKQAWDLLDSYTKGSLYERCTE